MSAEDWSLQVAGRSPTILGCPDRQNLEQRGHQYSPKREGGGGGAVLKFCSTFTSRTPQRSASPLTTVPRPTESLPPARMEFPPGQSSCIQERHKYLSVQSSFGRPDRLALLEYAIYESKKSSSMELSCHLESNWLHGTLASCYCWQVLP